MPNKPPFIESPNDPGSEEFRLDCLAWWLFTSKSATDLAECLKKQKALNTDAFKSRLRRCRAWWMLEHLNRVQIEADLMAMERQEEMQLRQHLNDMRKEVQELRRAAR